MINTSKSILNKYISLIFALWVSLNYCYLQNYSMSYNSFIFYIVLSYSLITIGYFLWLILHNQYKNKPIKIILSVSIIILIIGTTYWLHGVYKELFLLNLKYWGPGWVGLDNAGNNIHVETNPGLEKFRWALFYSYIPCIIISVLLYCMGPTIIKNDRPIISDIVKISVLLPIYGLTSNVLFVVLGTPYFCLSIMLKNKIVHCNKHLKLSIYLFIIFSIITTIVFAGPLDEYLRLQGGGPITGYFVIACFLFLINIWFYIAVFVGFIFIGIKNMTKYKFENPFSCGFKTGIICSPIFLFVLCCIASIFKWI